MKSTCGKIGRLFLGLRDGRSRIVLRCGTADTGSLLAVMQVGCRSRCMRQVHVVGDLSARVLLSSLCVYGFFAQRGVGGLGLAFLFVSREYECMLLLVCYESWYIRYKRVLKKENIKSATVI